jgi:hypothetical protein
MVIRSTPYVDRTHCFSVMALDTILFAKYCVCVYIMILQNTQCTYNVTVRRFRETIVAVEKQ